MEYVNLGKSGLKVSRLSLGCWNFGSPNPRWGKPGKVINRPAVSSAIIGVSRTEQLEENVGAIGWKLSEEHMEQLGSAFPV